MIIHSIPINISISNITNIKNIITYFFIRQF